jgi:hypothetical protein
MVVVVMEVVVVVAAAVVLSWDVSYFGRQEGGKLPGK